MIKKIPDATVKCGKLLNLYPEIDSSDFIVVIKCEWYQVLVLDDAVHVLPYMSGCLDPGHCSKVVR